MKTNPFVFFTSAIVILLFVVIAIIAPDAMGVVFGAIQSFITKQLGWFYIVSVAFFLLFVVWLFFSPYGRIRLGKDDEQPEYGFMTWFAMLFSAGMGIGLLFWSVAEPMYHFKSPPRGPSGADAAASAEQSRSEAAVLIQAAADQLDETTLHGMADAKNAASFDELLAARHQLSDTAKMPGHRASELAEPLKQAATALTGQGAPLTVVDDLKNATNLLSDARQQEGVAIEAAKQAMNITFFHWGLHAWAIYIVLGLALSYFAYRHDLPLSIRSALYPLLGERINGFAGNLVEILAIFGTLFGVATSLGFGVMQINAGLVQLGVVETSNYGTQLILITVITLIATASVVSGVNVGIRRLSELNMALGLILLAFVFIAGPTLLLLSSFVQSVGTYSKNLVEMTFRTDAFIGTKWQQSWTFFYWGWWISWSPFVGMFIARVSRGRTIREFILGVLLAPTFFTFIWLVVLGNTGLHYELTGQHAISATIFGADNGVAKAMFVMLAQLPWAAITSTIGMIVVATYFITSSDSASLVVDILAAGGDPDPPIPQRVFWALLEGTVAAALLYTGTAALSSLQTAAITTGLPVCVILILVCISLVKGLRAERMLTLAAAGQPIAPAQDDHLGVRPGESLAPQAILGATQGPSPSDVKYTNGAWRQTLASIVGRKAKNVTADPNAAEARKQIARFIDETVVPAFDEIAAELKNQGREVEVENLKYQARLNVQREGQEEFSYAIRGRTYHRTVLAFPELRNDKEPLLCWGEVIVRGGTRNGYNIDQWTKPGIIHSFLHEYAKWMGW